MLQKKSVLSIFEICVQVRFFWRQAALLRGGKAENSRRVPGGHCA